jgi:hypothetical protein
MRGQAHGDPEWVLLRTFDDPALARMTLDFLHDHDIPVQTRGDSPEGVRNLYSPFDIRIVVPSSRLEEALEVLEALTAEPARETPFRGPLPPPELASSGDEPSEAAQRKKNGAFGLVLAFLVPIGGGHFYARHSVAGAVIAAALVAFLVALGGGSVGAGAAWLTLIALDGLGSILAVRRANANRIPGPGRQALEALGLVGVAAAAGYAYWHMNFEPRVDRGSNANAIESPARLGPLLQ